MEAVRRWSVLSAMLVAMVFIVPNQQVSAQNKNKRNKRTQNFLVYAPSQEMAESVAYHAEKFREELAIYWLGKPLPPWTTPCPIEVVSSPHLAAQGSTTYNRSPVGNFQMRVIGSRERILDSVLPHEVTHTIMATHFGRPLPRWADEGICTTVEHSAERSKHELKLREYLSNRRGIPMNDLFRLTEYPSDLLPMYAQGYSVCRFLIEQSGPRQFIAFLEGYMDSLSWTANVQAHYGYGSLKQLQDRWLAWVAQGSGPVESFVSARSKASGSLASIAPPPVSSRSAADRSLALTAPAGASHASTGWYHRRLEQTALGQIANAQVAESQAPKPASAATGTRPLGPPSVISSGRYSVSQPQSELNFGSADPTASSQRSIPMYR